MNHMISCVVNEKERKKKKQKKKRVCIVMHAYSLVQMHVGRQGIRQERDRGARHKARERERERERERGRGHTGRQRDTVGGVI